VARCGVLAAVVAKEVSMTDQYALARELQARPTIAPGFVQPSYDGHGIANVPATVLRAFGVEPRHPGLDPAVVPPSLLDGVRRVIVLIVDAFGWGQLWAELERQPDLFLGQLIRRDDVAFAPLTSVFPSTTVNALTTANTGAQPIEHAILGYTLWLKEFGAVSEMITFGPFAGNWSYLQSGVDPTAFQPYPSLFKLVREEGGAESFIVNAAAYRHSPLSLMQTTGATYVPYITFSDAVTSMAALANRPGDDRMLIGAYYGNLDAICHEYGTGTPQHRAEVAHIDRMLQRALFEQVRRPDTLFMMYADHGHINCTPERTIDLTQDHELLRDLTVGPTGEGRARYMHVRDGRRAAVRAYLTERYGAISTLLDAEAAIAQGLFGGATPSERALERIGDFVLLPHENWYFHHHPSTPTRSRPLTMIGRHGGLAPEEMLVPFLAVRLG
jgi:predicted AlkP superfamily pyrophosphatase or phosphodiesterase